jgi:hypothetical protein
MFKKLANPNSFAILISAGLLGLYGSVLPQRLTGANHAGDSGDFLAAMLSRGVPHPTGYPTYMVLGRLFQLIPVGSPYFRGALLSAVAAACAAGLFYLWLKAEFKANGWMESIPALVSAVMWGVSPLVWSQAVIVEVHALQALFIVLALWWFRLISQAEPVPNRTRAIVFLSLCMGLALGNHVTILLLAPVFGYGLYLGWKNGLSALAFRWMGLLFFAGVMIYSYLPMAAINYPAINWGNTQMIEGFFWEISGNPYRGLVFNLPLSALVGRLGAWARLLVDQFGIPGLLVGLVGLVGSTNFKKPANLVILWMFASTTLFSLGYNTDDSMVYLIPALLAYAVWICQGIRMLITMRWRSAPVGGILSALLVVFIAARLTAIRNSVDPRLDTRPADFAERFLKSAPQNALILTQADADTFPLWYYHFGLGWRPDVRVIVTPLTQFGWYVNTIEHVYPDLALPPHPDGTEAWRTLLVQANPNREACYTQPDPGDKIEVLASCTLKGLP